MSQFALIAHNPRLATLGCTLDMEPDSRDARRKESRERPPRTAGALYRRVAAADINSTAGSGVDVVEFVNADVPEGCQDPLQV